MAKVMRGPGGEVIVGTLETISGTAVFSGEMTREQMEGGDFPYGGTTEVDWDSQRPVTRPDPTEDWGGKLLKVFLTEDGTEFLESQLVEVEVPDEAPPADPIPDGSKWLGHATADELEKIKEENSAGAAITMPAPPPAGSKWRFDWPFTSSLSDYEAHRGKVVTVVGPAPPGLASGLSMYFVRAEDGWEGYAKINELKPL